MDLHGFRKPLPAASSLRSKVQDKDDLFIQVVKTITAESQGDRKEEMVKTLSAKTETCKEMTNGKDDIEEKLLYVV